MSAGQSDREWFLHREFTEGLPPSVTHYTMKDRPTTVYFRPGLIPVFVQIRVWRTTWIPIDSFEPIAAVH